MLLWAHISYEQFMKKSNHFIFTSCTIMYKIHLNIFLRQMLTKKIFHNYFGVAHTKLYIEKICKFYSKISKTKFTIIRHSNIYGPRDKFDLTKGHFIGSSVKKLFARNNKSIKIFGNGSEKRDFLFINDFTNFVKIVLKKQISNYEIFNCSYGRSFSVITILNKLIKISNLNKKIKKIKASKSIKVKFC